MKKLALGVFLGIISSNIARYIDMNIFTEKNFVVGDCIVEKNAEFFIDEYMILKVGKRNYLYEYTELMVDDDGDYMEIYEDSFENVHKNFKKVECKEQTTNE